MVVVDAKVAEVVGAAVCAAVVERALEVLE